MVDGDLSPVDPQLLLKGMSSHLDAEGGIKNIAEAEHIIHLMKEANKLVTKCVYCNILKATKDQTTLGKFIEVGGWELLNDWLNTAKADGNNVFLIELMEVYKGMPVTITLLKSNSCAKTIKSLGKGDDKNIQTLSATIVDSWMKTIKAKGNSTADTSNQGQSDKSKRKHKHHHHHQGKLSKSAKIAQGDSPSDKRRDTPTNLDLNHDVDRTASPSDEVSSLDSISSTDQKTDSQQTRPKTVKAVPTKFRSTGLEQASLLPPAKKKTITPSIKSAVKRTSGSKLTIAPPEKKPRPTLEPVNVTSSNSNTSNNNTSPTESHGRIKIIPAKRLPSHEIYESSGFMDALTSQPLSGRRKRKGSQQKQPTTPTSPPQKQPLMPSFYQDTLETEENQETAEKDAGTSPPTESAGDDKPAETGNGENPDTNNVDTKDDSSSVGKEPSESGDAVEGSKPTESTSKKKKKTVQWAEESILRTFHYFVLDETERVNVNRVKDFDENKKAEILMERRHLENVRKRSHTDGMTEMVNWRRPAVIGMTAPLVKPGCNSTEKAVQKEREQGVLQALFFSKEMIPPTPAEPDPEIVDFTEPKIIPLEDEVSGCEVSYDSYPAPTSLQPTAASQPKQPQFSLPPDVAKMLADMAGQAKDSQAQVTESLMNNIAQDTVSNNVSNMVASIMQGQNIPGPGSEDELTAKLRVMLEPFKTQMKGMEHPPGIMAGGIPDGPGVPGPPGPAMGMLGHMPPGIPRPPFMGGGPRMRGPPPQFQGGMDEWGENMRGGPMMRGRGGPPRGMPRPRGPPPMGMMPPMRPRGRGRAHVILCRHFPAGTCRFGADCTFLHPGVNGPPL